MTGLGGGHIPHNRAWLNNVISLGYLFVTLAMLDSAFYIISSSRQLELILFANCSSCHSVYSDEEDLTDQLASKGE